MTKLESAALVVVVSTLLGACSGGGSSPQTAPLTLNITDAPVDPTQIAEVCVSFNRITLHYDGGQEVALDYAPLPSQVTPQTHCLSSGTWDGSAPVPPVRLDALGGALTVSLADSAQVPIGRISWIRLQFTDNAYVVDTAGGRHDLRCPSCDVTDHNTGRGFKLIHPFDVTGAGLNLVVDVDLQQSLHLDANGYVLRPTAALRVEEVAAVGAIAGRVDSSIVNLQHGAIYTGATVETGCAVYAYANPNHDAVPVDSYDGSPVVAVARVRYDTSLGQYRYSLDALPGGTAAVPTPYLVALTCGSDDPTVHDDTVPFYGAQNADVLAGQTTTVDFFGPR